MLPTPKEMADRFKRLLKIEEILKTKVLNQKADDVCWRDVYLELAELCGVEYDPELLPREQFMRYCGVFYDSLATGCPYKTPAEATRPTAELALAVKLRDTPIGRIHRNAYSVTIGDCRFHVGELGPSNCR